MSWSRLKKSVESRFAQSLQGRVSLHLTAFRGAHDQENFASIRIDGRDFLKMSLSAYCMESAYAEIGHLNHEEQEDFMAFYNVFLADDLRCAVNNLMNCSIAEVISSPHALTRALGMLDSRFGKRRLRVFDPSGQPEIVVSLWRFRCAAEGLSVGPRPGGKEVAEAEQGALSQELVAPGVPEFPVVVSFDGDLAGKKLSARPFYPAYKRAIRADSKGMILALKRSKAVARDYVRFLREIEAGGGDAEVPGSRLDSAAKAILVAWREISDPSERESFYEVLKWMQAKTEFLREPECVVAAAQICAASRHFLRPLRQWRAVTYNSGRQLESLLRHLFALYSVPPFMDNAWHGGNKTQQSWYLHIGSGLNIRTASGLPVALTKRMAHEFLQAPSHYSIEAALRWAQIFALGGDPSLVDAIMDTRLTASFENDEFWLSVLNFFVRNPMIDKNQINPIIDFIWHCKFEERVVFVEEGVAQSLGPLQPQFSMKGRSALALLKLVDEWHRELGHAGVSSASWKKCGVADFQFVAGTVESKNMRVYRIRELLSSAQLVAEGRRLRHCVASYSNSCLNGASTIWSMEKDEGEGFQPLITIELRMCDLRMRQVRGYANRRPEQIEKAVLERWASQEGLVLESYL